MIPNLSYLRRYDWVLLGTSLLLVAFGLMALYSTSLGSTGAEGSGTPVFAGAGFSNFWKQVIFAAVGISIAILLPMFNYRQLVGLARPLYVLSLFLLVAVLLFGDTVRGTRGWFGIAGFGIQPVELVKIFMIVYFARFFGDYARHPGGLKHVVGSGVALAAVVGLVILQPDFGSALLLMSVWGGMVLLAGVKRSYLLIMAGIAIVAITVAWVFVLKPYQKDRIAVFMDPDSDPLGRGYNVTQSIIAIGSGQFSGRGLGFGSQSQLRFLPERQTDFIFAVIAEELGLLGVMMVIVLFGTLFFRCYLLAKNAHDDFTLFLTIGIGIAIAVEAFTNIGGNLRMLPVTGVTLPFVSYGGSSLLTKFLMIGLLQSVAVRK